jgi:hypothetical protein
MTVVLCRPPNHVALVTCPILLHAASPVQLWAADRPWLLRGGCWQREGGGCLWASQGAAAGGPAIPFSKSGLGRCEVAARCGEPRPFLQGRPPLCWGGATTAAASVRAFTGRGGGSEAHHACCSSAARRVISLGVVPPRGAVQNYGLCGQVPPAVLQAGEGGFGSESKCMQGKLGARKRRSPRKAQATQAIEPQWGQCMAGVPGVLRRMGQRWIQGGEKSTSCSR